MWPPATRAQSTTPPHRGDDRRFGDGRERHVATWSTFGSFVDISAPGNNILTTCAGRRVRYWWGTSFATPVAAGTAALILSERPDLTPAQVDATLTSTATDRGRRGYDIYYGAGRVNAAAALQQVANLAPPADTTAPTVAIASPTGGTVAGMVAVSVNASDNVGVVRVELHVNGTTVASERGGAVASSLELGERRQRCRDIDCDSVRCSGQRQGVGVRRRDGGQSPHHPTRRRQAFRSPRPPAAASRAVSWSA